MSKPADILNAVDGAGKIMLLTHTHPDGDALGCLAAMDTFLARRGKKVFPVLDEELPLPYAFLFEGKKLYGFSEARTFCDLVIFMDCANEDRTGLDVGKIKDIPWINIDHHRSNTFFGNINLVDIEKASAAQIVYEIIKAAGAVISPETATAIFTGLSTDTGSFLYDNTGAAEHITAAELIEAGADQTVLRLNYYENVSRERLELTRYALDNLTFACGGRIAWVAFDLDVFLRLGARDEDGEGIIDMVRQIQGVDVAVTLREVPDGTVKVSFRSKTEFDVNMFASRFNGGGHAKAAGCTVDMPVANAAQKVMAELEKEYCGE